MPESTRKFEFGPYTLDVAEQRLLRNGRAVALTPKMFELLRVLVEQAGHLVEKEQLLKEVWGDTFVEEGSLNRGISVLRKTLGETPADRYIETIPKRGYRFIAPVHPDGASSVVEEPRASNPPVPAATTSTRTSRWVRSSVAAVLLLAIGAIVYAGLRRNTANGSTRAAASVHRQLTFTGRELTPALSPDGRRIAYVSNESPKRTLMVRDLSGGEPVEIFGAREVGWIRWSPDSSELMFAARGAGDDGLYIATTSPGSARKVVPAGPVVACWSPDGTTIAVALFVSRKIRFINRTGETLRTIALTGPNDWIWDLDWSPLSDRLLFVADDEEGRRSIWTITSDGRDQTKVLTSTSEILAARWAPAGDAVYYFVRVEQTVALYKAPLPRSTTTSSVSPIQLISGLETDYGFSVSNDGARLVYARAPFFSNLWVVQTAGSNGQPSQQTQLTYGTSLIERPRVSPDTQSIMFNMGYESHANLYSIPVSGGKPQQRTFLNGLSLGAVWSADGRRVAFASNDGGKARVWIANADGSAPHPLATSDLSKSFEIAWSPGERLMYQQTGNRNYSLVDVATGQHESLVSDGSVGWLFSPVYSPDAKRVAVSWNRATGRGLYIVDLESRRETLVSPVRQPSDSFPSPIGWSPDGRYIYAVDGKRAGYRGVTVPFEETLAEGRILKVDVTSGRTETTMTLPFEEIGSITMFPDGRRFVCVVYSSRSDVWIVEDFDPSVHSTSARR